MKKEAPNGDNLEADLAILEAVIPPGAKLTCREIEGIVGVRNGTVGQIERSALEKLRALFRRNRNGGIVRVQARDAAGVLAFSVPTALPDLKAGDPLPKEIVWMPAGTHAIQAGTVEGGSYAGTVICDEGAARVAQTGLAALQASGQRTWLDMNHDDGAAVADVRSFSWDPARGVIAHLDWTPRGETALRNKEFSSFSPTFEAHRTTGRVLGLIEGHALGGLVNAPAFKLMPALIAARFGGGTNNAPGVTPAKEHMKDLLIKLLAALKVQHDANATEDTLVALVAKHFTPADASAEVTALKKQLEDAEKAAVAARKENAEKIAALEKKQTENEAVVAGIQARRVDVTETDVSEVLAAYAAKDPSQLPANEAYSVQRAELALERANIYANELKPRLHKSGIRSEIRGALHGLLLHARAKGDTIMKVTARLSDNRVKLQSANALGTLSGSLITQQSMSLLKHDLPALGSFTTDFSNAAAKLNQTIITRVPTLQAEQTYDADTGYAKADVTATDIPVTINAHKYAQFAYNANELASSNRDLFGEQAEGAIYALGKGTVDALLALFTVANYDDAAQANVVAEADWKRSAVVAARKALRKRKVMVRDGFAIMNEDYFAALASDPVIVALATFQRADLIMEYILPKIAGFMPVGYADLPTTGNLAAILGTKESAIVATRLPYDYVDAQLGGNYGAVSQITDPASGLSVMLTQYVNHDLGRSNYRVALMRGVAVGHKPRVQLIKSA
jgi:hypothetical protein